MDRPQKRQRLNMDPDLSDSPDAPATRDDGEHELLSRPISPPEKRKRDMHVIKSPFQLTAIRDLSQSENVDTVTLKDILGDPLIAECWEFNYLHDIPFLMNAFDEDTRGLVKVHVIHGFWKTEDANRIALDEASQFKNVELHSAPMDEMFGTHHTKMMILLRHDDTAQVIIHTANMIPKDWTNMTNAVWRSPLLPLLHTSEISLSESRDDLPVGSGQRFKFDLLNYLKAYESRRRTCKSLIEQLWKYDFSNIRACLIASVPGRHQPNDSSTSAWGWPAMKRALKSVPCQKGKSEVVIQVSSIATLGATDKWLQESLFAALTPSRNHDTLAAKPAFKVVFPTACEIRKSLDGYASGGSIHTKIQSKQQEKQLHYLRPILHHWANDSPKGKPIQETIIDGGRKRAAPHIKTYIRYNEKNCIDWALITSANLSKQAWGDNAQNGTEVRVASWEIGVLFWPELLAGKEAIMRAAFRKDTPQVEASDEGKTVVGLRIPYSLPLQPYGHDEIPWVATMVHTEPDWMGRAWGVK